MPMLRQRRVPGTSVTILDVGQGSAALVSNGRRHSMIDTGRGIATVELLEASGIKSLHTVVISHADQDHVGGLLAMLTTGRIDVRRIVLNTDGTKGSKLWRDLAYAIDHRLEGGRVRVVQQIVRGQVLRVGVRGLRLEVIAPRHRIVQLGVGNKDAGGQRISSNSISAVIRVTSKHNGGVLLPGDLDAVGFDHMRDHLESTRSENLVLPHHGGQTGKTPAATEQMIRDLCEAVKPSRVFVSNGRGSYQHPLPIVIRAVRKSATDAKVICTQLSDRCMATATPQPGLRLRIPASSGASTNSCCAGSVQLLTTRQEPLDHFSAHETFVGGLTNAMCRAMPDDDLFWAAREAPVVAIPDTPIS